MKIGKVNWDNVFLEMLDIGSRSELTDALEPYYLGLSKEDCEMKGLNESYSEAVKSVAHLKDKTSLTFEEMCEWEGTVGWYESAGEEIGFREESLATGLIIAVWKLVNHYAMTTASGLKRRGITEFGDKFDFFRIGLALNSQPWALSVNAASNYVRHASDWAKLGTHLHENGASGDWKIDIPDSRETINPKRNLAILESLGMDVVTLLSNQDQAYAVAKKIGIIEKRNMEKCYFSWTSAVKDKAEALLK